MQTTISEGLLIALISSGLTLIGVIVSSILQLFQNKQNHNLFLSKELREKKIEIILRRVKIIEKDLEESSEKVDVYEQVARSVLTSKSTMKTPDFLISSEKRESLLNTFREKTFGVHSAVRFFDDDSKKLAKTYCELESNLNQLNEIYRKFLFETSEVSKKDLLPTELPTEFFNIMFRVLNLIDSCYGILIEREEILIEEVYS